MGLRVSSVDLEPDTVSQLLGRKPSISHRKGDPAPGNRRSFPSGYWNLSLDVTEPEGPEEGIVRLFELLPAETEFWTRLNQSYDVYLCIAFTMHTYNSGFGLSSALQTEIARRGLRVDYDIYAFNEREG